MAKKYISIKNNTLTNRIHKFAHKMELNHVLPVGLGSSVNSTSELGPAKLMTIAANQTSVTLVNLKSSTLYKFYFYATTIKGSGPSITKEAFTVMDTGTFKKLFGYTS